MKRYLLVALMACACTPGAATKPDAPVDPELAPFVLGGLPSDIQHRVFFDFEGKIHLVGYDLEPAGLVPLSTPIRLKLYWQSVARLQRGWRLFTHLLLPDGNMIPRVMMEDGRARATLDDLGPLRETKPGTDGEQALGPSRWLPGHVYVDQQVFQLPSDLTEQELTLLVGVWRERLRLQILSGPNDGENRAIVTKLSTAARSVQARPRPRSPAEPSKRPGTPPPSAMPRALQPNPTPARAGTLATAQPGE
jgi:hypothetical protein